MTQAEYISALYNWVDQFHQIMAFKQNHSQNPFAPFYQDFVKLIGNSQYSGDWENDVLKLEHRFYFVLQNQIPASQSSHFQILLSKITALLRPLKTLEVDGPPPSSLNPRLREDFLYRLTGIRKPLDQTVQSTQPDEHALIHTLYELSCFIAFVDDASKFLNPQTFRADWIEPIITWFDACTQVSTDLTSPALTQFWHQKLDEIKTMHLIPSEEMGMFFQANRIKYINLSEIIKVFRTNERLKTETFHAMRTPNYDCPYLNTIFSTMQDSSQIAEKSYRKKTWNIIKIIQHFREEGSFELLREIKALEQNAWEMMEKIALNIAPPSLFIKKDKIIHHSCVLFFNQESLLLQIFLKPNIQISRLTPDKIKNVARGAEKIIKLGGYRVDIDIPEFDVVAIERLVFFSRTTNMKDIELYTPEKKSDAIENALKGEFLFGGFKRIEFKDERNQLREIVFQVDAGENLAPFIEQKKHHALTAQQNRQAVMSFLLEVLEILKLHHVPRDLKVNNSGIKINDRDKSVKVKIFDYCGRLMTFTPYKNDGFTVIQRRQLSVMLNKPLKYYSDSEVELCRRQFGYELIHWLGQYLRAFNVFQLNLTPDLPFVRALKTFIDRHNAFTKNDLSFAIRLVQNDLRNLKTVRFLSEPNALPTVNDICDVLKDIGSEFERQMREYRENPH